MALGKERHGAMFMNRGGEGYPNPKGGEKILWDGERFADKDGSHGVLFFAMPHSPSGWSDELTVFHDDVSGGKHPIDKASLDVAMRSCRAFAAKGGDGVRILEIGCSSGFMLRRLRKDLPFSSVCGGDIVGGILQRLAGELKTEGIPTPLLRFDMSSCPFPDACFDVVIALNVLEHIRDDGAAVSEIHRVLKPDGIFVVEVPAGKNLYDDYDRELGHYRRYGRNELIKMFSAKGFKRKWLSHLGVIIFPIFWMTKVLRRHSRKSCEGESGKPSATSKNLIASSGGRTVDILFKIELLLGRIVPWPFGIRCVGVFAKTGQTGLTS